MDKHRLAVLRGRLQTAETGFEVRMFNALYVREIVTGILEDYPDMPDEERDRVENLKLAASETRGRML